MNPLSREDLSQVADFYKAYCLRMGKTIVGQQDVIRMVCVCLLGGGHALIEGVPGLGKTLLVKTFSRVLALPFSRIQFTPDLMPADILGTHLVNTDDKGRRYFELYKGPLFSQIVLADEINRAGPKTQSALLQAMQEQRISIFGTDYELAEPFMVLATQNPLEMEGTYPLPEAQVDRFFMKLLVSFPSQEDLALIMTHTGDQPREEPEAVADGNAILEMRQWAKNVPVAPHVQDFAVRLILATHPGQSAGIEQVPQYVRYGVSPRGARNLVTAAKVLALLDGRLNAAVEDIRAVAKPLLRHRLLLNVRAEAEGIDADDLIDALLEKVVP